MLNFDEYNDIFGNIFDEFAESFFLLLQNEEDIDGQIDVYEMLAAMVMSCGEEFSEKVKFIFKMFDFDQNEVLVQSELELTLKSTIEGLCKLAKVKCPGGEEVGHFSQAIMLAMDQDNSKSVDLVEFNGYIQDQLDL